MAKDKKENYKLNDENKKLLYKVQKIYNGTASKDRLEQMNRWLKEYNGQWWSEKTDKSKEYDSKIFANLIFSTVETKTPLLTDNRPIWNVRAREHFFQKYLNIIAKVLEYLWEKLEQDRKMYQVVKDSQIFHLGLKKIYYNNKADEIQIDVCDPRQFVISPGYEDIWDSAWCGEVKRMPMSWIKINYPEQYEKVKSNEIDVDEGSNLVDKWQEEEDEEDFVTVYDLWIRDESVEEYIDEESDKDTGAKKKVKKSRSKFPNGRLLCMTDTATLYDHPSPFKHGKPPYIPYYDYYSPHSVWGIPEAAQLENLNRELNVRLQDIVWHANKHARQNYLMRSDSGLDPEQIKKELSEGDNIWVDNSIGDRPALEVIKIQDLTNIHEKIIQLILALYEEVSGVTDVTKGMIGKKQRQSASEVSILIESSYTRTRQGVRSFEWSIQRELYLILELIQQFYSDERSFSFREDQNVSFGKFNNSPEMLEKSVKPVQEPMERDEEYAKRMAEDEDYQAVLEYLDREKVDRVYAAFDLEIQTNSTLPMDRQSLANLALRLFELKAIDREALFEILHFPRGKEIEERMDQKEQQLIQAKMGAGGGGGQAGMGASAPVMPGPPGAAGRTPIPVRPVAVSQ